MSQSSTYVHTELAGLYVHVPFCRAKCRYCGFYSEPISGHDPQRLTSALLTELDRYQGEESIYTAYIGGGSPTALPSDLLVQLATRISALWPHLYEFTVECNPGQVRQDLLDRLRKSGVNRLSIGAQSFHSYELEQLGRCHDVGQIAEAVRQAKAAGFENIGLDLIFAMPGSTIESWQYSLESAIDLGVQHVSSYSLSFEEGTPMELGRQAGQIQPVDEETDRRMYESAMERLSLAGFEHYEVSNFARPGFPCQHNRGYWLNLPFIGIGPAAASYWLGRRTLNVADIYEYVVAIEGGTDPTTEMTVPTELDRLCETAVLNLRMREGIDLERFRRQTGYNALEVFAEPIRNHRSLGLIEVDAHYIRLTQEALPIADSVLCDFAALETVSSHTRGAL